MGPFQRQQRILCRENVKRRGRLKKESERERVQNEGFPFCGGDPRLISVARHYETRELDGCFRLRSEFANALFWKGR
uniref:Uncharacterized protein n=1 Tax=Globodera rostochiensis TaxID=31243 RepID=A0A914HMK3_GLORO